MPWKRQKKNSHSRGPAGNYTNLKDPLPNPPDGTAWVFIPQTKEWCITQVAVSVQEEDTTDSDFNSAAVVIDAEQKSRGDALKSIRSGDGTVVEAAMMVDSIVPASDYVTHRLESTDTLQGICLKYKVSPTTLRQLNGFSGSNLSLAPHTILLPKYSTSSSLTTNYNNKIHPSKTDDTSKEQKIHRFLHALKFSGDSRHRCATTLSTAALGRKEAIAYLDMNDGNLEDAIQDAKDDNGWEDGGVESSIWCCFN